MHPQIAVVTHPLAGRLVPMLLMFIGIMFLGVVGFGQGEMVHEFVHDSRHVLAFPCH